MTKRAFSRITKKTALHLLQGFAAAKTAGYPALRLFGTWSNRRFIIEKILVSEDDIFDPEMDFYSMTLRVSSSIDATSLASACTKFGAKVERLSRDAVAGVFDRDISYDDEKTHIVHRHHHVALCGHKPTKWVNTSKAKDIANEDCLLCRSAAETRPLHRARYHPLSTTSLNKFVPN